jgi:hypothetical protein
MGLFRKMLGYMKAKGAAPSQTVHDERFLAPERIQAASF